MTTIHKLKIYENTLYVSMADTSTDGGVPADFLLTGDLKRLAAALAVNMQRYPELLEVINESVAMHRILISS
jgi:hypothetical protein